VDRAPQPVSLRERPQRHRVISVAFTSTVLKLPYGFIYVCPGIEQHAAVIRVGFQIIRIDLDGPS